MPSIYEVQATPIAFLVWVLAVVALTKVLFGSFFIMELSRYVYNLGAATREKMSKLDWELVNNLKYDQDVVERSQMAAPQRLTTEERIAKVLELRKLTRGTTLYRMWSYFVGCFACQSLWSATILLTTLGGGWVWSLVPSALAYSAAAILISTWIRQRTLIAQEPQQQQRGVGKPCKGRDCG